MWDALWLDLSLATMAGAAPYGAIADGAIAAADGKIVWIGPRAALPGATFTLRETRMPNIALMRRLGIPIALGSNCNPGSSPTTSLLLMLNMACTLYGLTPEEALAAVTRNSARALGRVHEIGTLEVGKAADFAIWDIETPAELAYWLGRNLLKGAVFAGEAVG